MSSAAQDIGNSSGTNNSLQIQESIDSDIQSDHGDRPLEQGDRARIWRHANLHGIELFQGSYKNYQFAKHFHRMPAIGVVDRGCMSSYCRRANHVLGTGTVLLLNPGEIHAPAPANSTGGWSFRMFYLEEKLFRSASLNFSLQNLRFRHPFVQDSELASTLFRFHLNLEKSGDRLHFESVFLSIVSRLTERHSEAVSPSVQLKPDKARIELARQYLEAHYDQNVSLAALADVASLSSSHFLRMFRETVGLTPHAYLIQVRIEFAMSLLRDGIPLVDVANRVGFTDQSHFTKKFKRIFGVTPGQYNWAARAAPRRSSRKTHSERGCRSRNK